MIQMVGIVGLGAVGVLFGQKFLEGLGRERVLAIADSARIARYQKDGVYANGKICDFQYVEAEKAPKVDLLIFATKYHSLREAISVGAGACGEQTIVLSFLNGVTSEQMIEEHLHPAHLLYCTVQGMDATKEGNQLFYTKAGSIAFGEKDGRRSESVAALEELLKEAGIAYLIPEDILHQQWSKWMLNVGVNQACAVYGVGYGGIQKDGEERRAMIAAMKEAKAAAGAEGVCLTDEELDEWVKLMDTLSPAGEPSMRQDTKAGRKTEVELFAGLVRRLGRKHGISTPQNDKFYEALA